MGLKSVGIQIKIITDACWEPGSIVMDITMKERIKKKLINAGDLKISKKQKRKKKRKEKSKEKNTALCIHEAFLYSCQKAQEKKDQALGKSVEIEER